MTTTLHALAEHGQSPWIDFLSRHFVRDGDLAGLVEQGVGGVTSNPTIFQGAIADGDAYDEQLKELLASEQDPKEVFLALAREDIRGACDLLRGVFDRGDSTRDGWVSLEVDPNLAHDAAGHRGRGQADRGDDRPPQPVREDPGHRGGSERDRGDDRGRDPGQRHAAVLTRTPSRGGARVPGGPKRLRESGGDLSTVASVASFFVSRVDTETDRRLDEIGGHDDLKGKLAVANAKLAYQSYKELFSGAEWDELEAAGGSPQRCLWASTSVKNPDYPDLLYVESLVGPATVNTMPRETVEALLDHGQIDRHARAGVDEARETFERLADAGVDYDDVVAVLEREGVQKFADSFRELIDGVAAKRDQFATA